MNCTAWNSVVANALTNSPNAVPRTASATATTSSSPTPPGTSRWHTHTANPVATTAWIAAITPKASAYPATKSPLPSGIVDGRGVRTAARATS